MFNQFGFYLFINHSLIKTEKDEKKIGRTIWGLVGLGAFGYNSSNSSINNKITNNNFNSQNLIITTTKSHRNKQLDRTLDLLKPSKIIRAGGAGYKSLLVLEDVADSYLYPAPGCKRWDTAAPSAILKSVGGTLTDINGIEYDYHKNVQHNNATGVLATKNLELHKWIVDSIPADVKSDLKSPTLTSQL